MRALGASADGADQIIKGETAHCLMILLVIGHIQYFFNAHDANSNVEDADNFAWKLDLICNGIASENLINIDNTEREFGADKNILNVSRCQRSRRPKEK